MDRLCNKPWLKNLAVLPILLIGALISLRCGWVERSGESVRDPNLVAKELITSSDARTLIDFLGSDSLMGRKTPSPGLTIAGDYIANHFKSYGLEPVNGSYFEDFNLALVRLVDPNFMKLSKGGLQRAYQIKTDFMPFELTANNEVQGEVVFAGYGITAPEYHYDDYANVNVRGRIVFLLRHEPQENDSSSIFLGTRLTEHAQLRIKVQNAIDHGAVAVLLASDPLNHVSMAPRGFPWPSLYKNIPEDALPLTLAITEEKKIPVVHVGPSVIEDLLGSVDSLKSLESSIDSTLQPNAFLLKGLTLDVRTSTSTTLAPTRNVVGVLRGSDPALRDEIVIVGAHYDHVGTLQSHKEGEDYIFNGADDNASGTTGLLEIAKAFGEGNLRPKRTVLFIAFSSEELGLLGSEAYVESPLFPLGKTVAMLNMDMIGRNAPDTVSIGGANRSPELKQMNEHANGQVGMVLQYNIDQYFTRSDQASFARQHIPALFYHTGEHADYHRVSDNPDKIDTNKLSKIARLVFLTTWEAANSPTKPVYRELQ